ncbi:MAG: protein IQM3-like [Gammaproteobacteria bacterium]|nr:protein IQM3-like [Gammaproteobacteria bacterium]
MRIWRDIISRGAWLGIMQRFKKGDVDNDNNAFTTSKAAPVGKVAQLRGVFDRSLSSRSTALETLTNKIESYHDIAKGEYRNIDARIAALRGISAFANDFIKTFGVDMQSAATRYGESKARDPSLGNAYKSSNPRDNTLDRHILTLARRSLRKAGYLQMLKNYYALGGAGYAYRSPQALLGLIRAPKESNNEFVGLEPGLRLEQLDPVHRSNYEVMNDGACGRAFQLWAADARQDKPFFMWLETSLVCLEDNKYEADAQSVPYNRLDNKTGAGGNGQKILFFPAPMQALDLDHLDAAPQLCSTAGYSCDPPKDPTGNGGAGVAAYVWSQESELFIAEHRGGVFHHSSFLSGQRVRCAGMIRIDNGRVSAISNNSGHYKPRKQQMVNMLRFLAGAGAFTPGAQVEVFLGAHQTFNGTPAAFLSAHG